MISLEAALTLMRENGLDLATKLVSTSSALLCILAEDLYASMDLPPFDNSAVDGFALDCHSLSDTRILKTSSFIRAVGQNPQELLARSAIKITTGAPIPLGANAVAMKEDIELIYDGAHFLRPVHMGDHIRYRGEDIKAGEKIASVGAKVTPQLIGALYGFGIGKIRIFCPPKIRIISTGDELAEIGRSLQFGEGYYLVGPMLEAQCRLLGIDDVSSVLVGDDVDAIHNAIIEASCADIVLLTGGISKGDYDLVRPALARAGVFELFYQGLWRPGKPLYCGRNQRVRFFGLPGNPVAVFVCFFVFVRQLILWGMKVKDSCHSGVLMADFQKKAGITVFARAFVNENNELAMLDGQGSHQIYHLSKANALCVLPSEQSIVKAKTVLQYYPI
jgi:molybdopterin molybdotransferase